MSRELVIRIEQRLNALGRSAAEVSRKAGLSVDAIRNIQRRAEGNPSAGVSTRTIHALSEALETSVEWLLTGRDHAAMPGPAFRSPGIRPAGLPTKSMANSMARSMAGLAQEPEPPARLIPVFGSAAGSITGAGAFALSPSPVEYLAAPPALASVRDAYALIVTGSSMEPRYFTGDIIWVHPHRPIRPGDHVAIQEERDGGVQAWIKRFDRMTETHLICWQYNPPSTIEFLRKPVTAIHRIMTTNELLGV